MEIRLKKFIDLTTEELYQLLQLRQEVFIIEQNCPYPDIDDYDAKADHLLIYEHKNLIAYSRIFEPGVKFEHSSSIGRIVVKSSHRKGTTGRLLISKSIDFCRNEYPDHAIRIEAQAALEKYYENYGFKSEGPVYVVDDIDHQQMCYDFEEE